MEPSVHVHSSLSLVPNQDQPLASIHVRPFQPGDEIAFRELNEAWITKYFTIEPAERPYLEDPVRNIVEVGGYIFMAVAGEVAVGCCALLPMEPGAFEVAKMAVTENLRGRGIGRKVLEFVIGHGKKIGATHLYLETNRRLANAIHLYESVGFQHVSPDQVIPSPYGRANVFMEMNL
jgi:GNAT superfamily N-acetyltransferase